MASAKYVEALKEKTIIGIGTDLASEKNRLIPLPLIASYASEDISWRYCTSLNTIGMAYPAMGGIPIFLRIRGISLGSIRAKEVTAPAPTKVIEIDVNRAFFHPWNTSPNRKDGINSIK
ncbi:MAG: hypothetical protein QW765_04760 [Fervidicoccaceae archaeon]